MWFFLQWIHWGGTHTNQSSLGLDPCSRVSRFFPCSYSWLWEFFLYNQPLVWLTLKEHIVTLRSGCQQPVDWVCEQARVMLFHLPVCSFTIPSTGRVSHPHPPLINQEVITAVQLFLESTSYDSHPFFNHFLSWALQSYFQPAFHLFPARQQDFG